MTLEDEGVQEFMAVIEAGWLRSDDDGFWIAHPDGRDFAVTPSGMEILNWLIAEGIMESATVN